MALTETRPTTDSEAVVAPQQPAPSAVERLIGSGDHLSIGRTFIVLSLVLGLVSAAGLTLSGIDTVTGNDLLGTAAPMVWASSTLGLVLGGVMPLLLGIAIAIVPLQVGSPSLSFPRAASLALWSWFVGAIVFAVSVVIEGGIAGTDMDAARLGNLAVGLMMIALGLASVTVATTVLSHRPVGMRLSKAPFFSWSMLVAAPVWIVTLGAAFGGVLLGQVGQYNAAGVALNYVDTVSWAWHVPSVYLLAIPVLGIAADITAKAAGRRISNYGLVQGFIAAYGVLSFGAWAQTPRSMNNIIWVGWVAVAALPVLGLLGALADTLRRSKPAFSAAAMSIPLSLLLVLGGVLAGALQALDTAGTEWLFGFDTVWLEAAQLIFLASAALVGAVGGLAYWSDKLWGETKDASSKASVTAILLGGGLLGLVLGLQGILLASSDGLADEAFGVGIAAGAALLALGVLSALGGALGAARSGADGPSTVDDTGLTLEWATASPPAPGNFTEPLPPVSSPYPLLDLRAGDADEERN
jgi:heme/copper-type cytochrome/quinol oxidase subunit 1